MSLKLSDKTNFKFCYLYGSVGQLELDFPSSIQVFMRNAHILASINLSFTISIVRIYKVKVASKASKKKILASAHAKILGYITAFTMNITLENLDSTRKVIVLVDLIILHGGNTVSAILRLHIVIGKKEIIPKLCIRMLASKMSSWVV